MPVVTADEKQAKLPVQQLAILSVCRFAEPLALTGVFPYLPEMIESFGVSKEDVPNWAGVTSAVFSLAQALTSIQWGRASDRYGRKPVILTALFCAMTTSLAFGFSQTLTQAVIARALAGASNGNVGILRTTVAELVPQRSLQPRAFSIMPLVWSVGSSFGPILGGVLAVPARQYPRIFGHSQFFKKYAFALPNLVASVVFVIGLLVGILFLRETLESKKHRKDYGLLLGQALTRSCRRRRRASGATQCLGGNDEEHVPTSPRMARRHPMKPPAQPGWNEVFSRQSNLNVLAYTLLAFHAVAFDQLVPVFLHLPSHDHLPDAPPVNRLPFHFSGGFELPSSRIGTLFTAMGVFGMVCQFAVFPPVARRYGSLACFRVVTLIFPISYVLTPYTILLPTEKLQQGAMFALMLLKSIAAVFAFPCTTILLTNSARSVAILGTLNGVAVSTSAIGRAMGPFLGGQSFSWGLKRGTVVVPWFILAATAVLGHIVTWWLVEGDGPSSGNSQEDYGNDEEVVYEDEEEIMLLPNENDANSGQVTGLIITGDENGEGAPSIGLYVEPNDAQSEAGEDETFLASSGLTKMSSRDSRQSRAQFVGTTLMRRNSSPLMRRASSRSLS